jgi:D-amino-acid oxidase
MSASTFALAPLSLLSACAVGKRIQPLRSRAPAAPDLSFIGSACGLPPVQVSEEREIRTVVGLRPYRPSGFVVKAEKFGDTLVVHNYGHGGGGITLSWGTSKLAVDLGAPGHVGTVAVLGSGAVGLATARLLQEAGFAVTLYTKALPPETTSNIAGGQWYPSLVSDPSRRTYLFNQQFLAAAGYAYRRYQIMVGPRFGIRWMRNYFLNNIGFEESSYLGKESVLASMMPEYRELATHEHPFIGFKFVMQFDSMIIEPPVYLLAMLSEFRLALGKLVIVELTDLNSIQALPEKLVFNCTGLGTKSLFNDSELTPVKGQLTFLLPQPEVQYAVCPGNLNMFSRSDGILLGGTHEEGAWSLEPDFLKKQQILNEHKAFFGAFRKC